MTTHAPARSSRWWLWWQAPAGAADSTQDEAHLAVPDLDRVWRAYVRRFDLEHTFRFLKQTLNWTLPRVRHPEQAARWSRLVVLAYTQLSLARPLVADSRLPWERPLTRPHLTPSRVRHDRRNVLAPVASLVRSLGDRLLSTSTVEA